MTGKKSTYYVAVIVAALTTAGLSAIAIVETLFLRVELGASFSLIGSLLGPAALAFLLFSPFMNTLADRMGHGRYLTWTSLALTLASVGAALLTNPGLYLAPKVVIILFAPLSIPILIGFLREFFRGSREMDHLLYFFGGGAAIGGVVGVVLAGFVAHNFLFGHVYMLSAGLFGVAGLLSTSIPNNLVARYRQKHTLNPWERLAKGFSPKYRSLAVLVFVSQAYWSVRDFVLPLFLEGRGVSLFVIGLLFGIAGFVAFLSMAPVRQLLHKNPARQVLLMGCLFLGVSGLLFPFGFLIPVLFGFLLYGLSDGFLTPGVGDVVHERSSGREAPQVLASLGAVGALAWVVTPLVVGVLLETGLSYRVVLLVSSLLLIWLFLYLRKRWSKKHFWPQISFSKKKKFIW